MSLSIEIGGRTIGRDQPAYVMALAGSAHEGDVQLGYKLIETAGRAGAEAIVFDVPSAASGGGSRRLSERDFKALLGHAYHVRMTALGTPGDEAGVALLASLDIAAFVIDDSDVALLSSAARTGRPILVRNRGSMETMAGAIETGRAAGNDAIVPLWSGSVAEAAGQFEDRPIGCVSDRLVPSNGVEARGLGATIIAVPYGLSASAELTALVRAVRTTEAAGIHTQSRRS